MEDTGQLAYPWVSSLVDVCLNYNGLSTGKVSQDNIFRHFHVDFNVTSKVLYSGGFEKSQLISVV